jgi:homoserine O-acetyltransferase
VVTVADMVEAQRWLLDALDIPSILCATGGSMGGMQALQWGVSYPNRLRSAIVLASTARTSAQTIALTSPRQAIYADPTGTRVTITEKSRQTPGWPWPG